MLARYSSDFVVFRELIQNADDASASKFFLDFTVEKSNKNNEVRLASLLPPTLLFSCSLCSFVVFPLFS
jgi:hypothetical protein